MTVAGKRDEGVHLQQVCQLSACDNTDFAAREITYPETLLGFRLGTPRCAEQSVTSDEPVREGFGRAQSCVNRCEWTSATPLCCWLLCIFLLVFCESSAEVTRPVVDHAVPS